MKKYLILVICALILTGCSATVDINVDDYYDTTEKTTISFNNSQAVGYESVNDYVNKYLDFYKSAIELRKYSYTFDEGEKESSVTFNKEKEDICTYVNNNMFSVYLYNVLKCTDDGEYYIIQSEGVNSLSLPSNKKKFNIEKLTINVTLPIRAEENNADFIGENKYTWQYDLNSHSNKSIYLKISKTLLAENKQKVESKDKFMSGVKIFLIVIIIIGLLFVGLIKGKKLSESHDENKLEY